MKKYHNWLGVISRIVITQRLNALKNASASRLRILDGLRVQMMQQNGRLIG